MIRAAIVTISDGVTAGTREDQSGVDLAHRAVELGWSVDDRRVVPDDAGAISPLLIALVSSGAST